ncbi:MAG: RNA polymerase sigma-70 factor [Bacteroidales bacterium]|nr:RNA polymerase sigma-70 factor [Bacteroidales bacterium]
MKKDLKIALEKLKSGDEGFYQSLFKEYYSGLSFYAFKYVKDLEIAKEIVQDLFVKIYEKRYSLTIDISLKSYLYRAVHNSCMNHLQQVSIREHHHGVIRTDMDEIENFSEDVVFAVELEQKIYNEIEKLPVQCKKIFKMNRFDGLSNSDIAEKLNLSKRTVETQISKALKILRNKLADDINPE